MFCSTERVDEMKFNLSTTLPIAIGLFLLLRSGILPSTSVQQLPTLTTVFSADSSSPAIAFQTAECWVIPAEHKTGVYIAFIVDGISVEQLQAFFVYSSGEHMKTHIYTELHDPTLPSNEYRVNPLLSEKYADANLCPASILITSTGDLVEASAPVTISNAE